jgi:DNA invertase Pin-like site-specific DNA recombinase
LWFRSRALAATSNVTWCIAGADDRLITRYNFGQVSGFGTGLAAHTFGGRRHAPRWQLGFYAVFLMVREAQIIDGAAGCEVIREEQKSGATLDGRSQLTTILDFIHAGETLVVTRIDRLARSLRDLQVIVDRLKSKGAYLLATEQSVDTATAAGKAFFDMLGVFAEFETNLRRERQAEGIAAAKTRGVYKGRPPKIDRAEIRRRLQQGHGPTKIARDLGISRGTVYQVRTGTPE